MKSWRFEKPKQSLALYFDEICLIISFSILCLLGATAESPTLFEPVMRSRLTCVGLVALPIFVIAAAARGRLARIRSFLRAYWPIVGTLAVYESLKHLHANRITVWLGIAPKDALMLRIDELLFGRALPLRLEVLATDTFTPVMWFFYVWVYYLGPIVMLGIAYFVWEDEQLFLRLRQALVLGLLGGYVIYLIVPVAGPLFLIGEQFTRPITTQPVIGRLAFDQLRYNWDCFPSLHTAIPWLLCFVAWRRLTGVGRAFAVMTAGVVTLSTVVLRYHYGIDVVAGIVWAVLVAKFVVRSTWLTKPIWLGTKPGC